MCDHSIVMMGMCALCGVDLNAKEKKTISEIVMRGTVEGQVRNSAHKRSFATTSASIAMVHSIPELVVSQERATQIGQADIARLLQKRQLVLLVDLDQTLVHTTNERIPADMKLKDVHHFQMGNGPYIVWYHTKLRPGATKFLESVSGSYELHIATFGSRLYAHTIASFLDPDKKLFHSSRILSRDECFSPLTKTANLANLFPCGDSLVCIIDDRDEVWNFAPNLVRVRPYFFFANTGDINAPPGSVKTGQSQENLEGAEMNIGHDVKRRKIDESSQVNDVEDTDDYLLYLPDILNKIHSTFYDEYDKYQKDPATCSMPDVKKVVPMLKSKVLAGCNVVFSGVIPKNIPVALSRPYSVAKELGATIQDEVISEPSEQRTSHVIAAYWNTAKVKAAQELAEKSACHIVTLGWLWSCSERWERADERLFALPKETDSNSAIREDERGANKSKKPPKESSTSPGDQAKEETPGPSTFFEEATSEDDQALALSNDVIREMNDEVTKALAEDGLSLDSCSSGEDKGGPDTDAEEQNPEAEEEDSQSSKSGPTNGEASESSSDDDS